MINSILSSVLFLVFLVLSAFHFYWFLGGKWGVKYVIPKKNDQTSNFAIPKFATLIAALILLFFGLVYVEKISFLTLFILPKIANYVFWIIPSIFILRAIGDFNYVGFFKKIKHTTFAKADTKLFSPLCLVIGTLGIILQTNLF